MWICTSGQAAEEPCGILGKVIGRQNVPKHGLQTLLLQGAEISQLLLKSQHVPEIKRIHLPPKDWEVTGLQA